MFNRLNRNVAFAVCLGGVSLFAIGCADTDETTVATAAATAESQQEEERPTAVATADAENGAAHRSERTEAAPQLGAAHANQLDAIGVQGDTNLDSAQRPQREPSPPQREASGQESDELFFSPSRQFETIEASLPERERRQLVDRAHTGQSIEVVPTLLDLGTMGTSQTKTGTMTLRNISDHPVMIENSRTSCGCTVANVPRNQYLQPGESVDVDVSLRSSTRPQVLTKTVTFLIRDHPPITARVRGEVVSFVTIEPTILNADAMTEQTVTIKSEDGQPFRVTSVHPKITVETQSEGPASKHEFTIAWDQWMELGEARRLIFYTDHPEVPQVMATIRAPRRSIDDPAEREARQRPDREPAGPNPFALVLRGNTEQVLQLLSEGELDLEARDRTGQTLLALAAQLGNVDIVDALIEAGMDVNTIDSVGRTPLMNAGQAKHPDVVKRLVEADADLNVTDSTIGATALAWTVAFGDPVSAKHMIDAGADLNMPAETTGFTPVIWAAGFGQPQSVKYLVDAGADIEATDRIEGATALIHAARTGRVENVAALIAAGADIEATDRNGKTPLLMAAGSSGADVATVKALVEAGANLHARDRGGLGVLDHARGRQDANAQEVMTYLSSLVGEDSD